MKLTWLFIVGVSILALVSTTELIYADFGDVSLIHACLDKKSKPRIVGPDDSCKASETPVHWTIAGLLGPQGDQGPQGDTGLQGPQGPKGDKGDTGGTGSQGPKGDTGNQGIQGPKGDDGGKGDKGDTGDTGAIDLSMISLRTCTDVFTCFCLENERVLGGGAECELPFLGIHLRNSSPIVESYDDGTPHEGWFAECTTGQDTPFAPSTTRVVCIAP